jgi:hypothetical protein
MVDARRMRHRTVADSRAGFFRAMDHMRGYFVTASRRSIQCREIEFARS